MLTGKGVKRHPEQQYESIEGVALEAKVDPGGFRGDCYNFGKSAHMAWEYPQPRKEEGEKSNQAGEDAHIQINLAEEDTYRDVEVFELFLLVVEERINRPEIIDTKITGIKTHILGGTE